MMGRTLKLIVGGLLPVVIVHSDITSAAASAPSARDVNAPRQVQFDFNEFTWSSIDIAPDGSSIVFDALGDIYLADIGGGEARAVLVGSDWDMMPRFSPDGRKLLFASNRGGGGFSIWSASLKGDDLVEEIPSNDGNDLIFPEWDASCGGAVAEKRYGVASTIPFSEIGLEWRGQRGGGNSCDRIPVIKGANSPSFADDGASIFYSRSGVIGHYDRGTGEAKDLAISNSPGEYLFAPTGSSDGRWLAFMSMDKFSFRLKLMDRSSGKVSTLAEAAKSEIIAGVAPGFAFTPDSRSIVALWKRKITRFDVESLKSAVIPISARFSQAMATQPRPIWNLNSDLITLRQTESFSASADLKRVVFGSAGRLWLRDKKSRSLRELDVQSPARKMAPSISPDGKRMLHVRWNSGGSGDIVVSTFNNGRAQQRIVGTSGLFMNPVWSPDGKMIGRLNWHPAEARSPDIAEGSTDLEIVDAASGSVTILQRALATPVSRSQLATPLAFSQDGQKIFFVEGYYDYKKVSDFNALYALSIHSRQRERIASIPAEISQIIHIDTVRNVAVIGGIEETLILPLYKAKSLPASPAIDDIERISTKVDGAYAVDQVRTCGKQTCWARGTELFTVDNAGKSTKLLDFRVRFARPHPTGSIAFVGANIITMTHEGTLRDQTVVVEKGRITKIGPRDSFKLSRSTTTIDARGMTILPGYIDTHAHPFPRGDMEFNPFQRSAYVSNLAYGVTTTAELSGSLGVFADATRIDLGDIAGPRLLAVGYPVMGYRQSGTSPKIQSYADAQRVVRVLKQHGAFAIKSYEVARHDARRWLVDAAREEKMRVFTHYSQILWMPMVSAAEGHAGLEHVTSMPSIGSDWAQFLAASGTTFTPTLFNAMYVKFNPYCTVWPNQAAVDIKARRFVSESDISRQVRPPCDDGPAPVNVWIKDMADIVAAGGNISMGAHGELQGPDVHYELKALVAGGFTPLQALEAYTVRGARKLGLEEQIGKIAPGYLADLQILRDDPTENISNSQSIRYVMVRGMLYDADTMAQVWPITAGR
jgi:imidazolonepropionase-like amidohydrolase/Tol biopolymer transport system component